MTYCHVVTSTKISGMLCCFRCVAGMSSIKLAVEAPNCICLGRIFEVAVVLTVLDLMVAVGEERLLRFRSGLVKEVRSKRFYELVQALPVLFFHWISGG